VSENSVVELIQETISLLKEAERRFDHEEVNRVSVCLECRKIYVEPRKFCDCPLAELDDEELETHMKEKSCVCLDHNPEYQSCLDNEHPLLEVEAWEGPTDIFGALICLEWILKQIKGKGG